MRRADDVGQAEQGTVLGGLDLEDVEGGAGHLARLQRLGVARSSTRPPRAQLTMRTPVLVFFSAAHR